MFAKIKEKANEIVTSKNYLKITCLNLAATTALAVSGLPVSATEGSTAGGDMSSVTGGVTTLTTVMGDLWTFMVANPLLCVYMAAGLVSVCFGLFKKGKRASR